MTHTGPESEVLGSPSRTLLRFLGSVAVLPPIMAARMVASSDALQDASAFSEWLVDTL